MPTNAIRRRIEELLESQGKTQSDLARFLGVSAQAVNNWLRSGVEPKSARRQRLAEFFGMSEAELLFGTSSKPSSRIPVIEWYAACGNGLSRPAELSSSTIEWVSPSCPIGPRTFALRMRDDSMTNPAGELSLPAGAYLVVEPDVQREHGDIVVVCRSGEPMLGQLASLGGRTLLKPLNPRYPISELTALDAPVGVVREYSVRLK